MGIMGAMEPLEFVKGHGTGNDFVIIPDPEGALPLPAALVAGLCDRRFGIGGDGVLRVVRTAAAGEPAWVGTAEWFMDYRNADGSVAEMCGNGVRVFARYLVETGLVGTGEVTIATRSGPVVAVVTGEAVSVTMDRPRVTGESTATLAGRVLPGVAVAAGNPHLVCPLPAERELAGLDLTGAPGTDPGRFPDGVNVEFTAPPPGGAPPGGQPGSGPVRIRVYERGVGETLSCGSGACAVAVATLHATGRTSGVVTVDPPGGRLVVSVTGDGCVLTGPAVLVAQGTVAVSALRRPTSPGAGSAGRDGGPGANSAAPAR
jgi:diaminopimelate epimerase